MRHLWLQPRFFVTLPLLTKLASYKSLDLSWDPVLGYHVRFREVVSTLLFFDSFGPCSGCITWMLMAAMPAGKAYSRELLLSLRTTAQLLQCDVREYIDSLTRKTRRGCRAGRPRRTQPTHTYIHGSSIPIVTGNRPPPRRVSLSVCAS